MLWAFSPAELVFLCASRVLLDLVKGRATRGSFGRSAFCWWLARFCCHTQRVLLTRCLPSALLTTYSFLALHPMHRYWQFCHCAGGGRRGDGARAVGAAATPVWLLGEQPRASPGTHHRRCWCGSRAGERRLCPPHRGSQDGRPGRRGGSRRQVRKTEARGGD